MYAFSEMKAKNSLSPVSKVSNIYQKKKSELSVSNGILSNE